MEASNHSEVRDIGCTSETVRASEASNLASTDEGYLGGCEVSSHEARVADSGKMSTEQSMGQSRHYNGLNWKHLRKEYVIGRGGYFGHDLLYDSKLV
ncbi:hypothetical protein L3X38_012338 [Prunus dulcis]|uniref:Uncharacterized protein n=1 Tax=Prunus dulcis TaxID=3755 RepID=A0AAD4WLJ7_PRUDU|nr:hypothetical protein L3X38_012338 [Prunus dulcis]